jgi:hypothetical protein
VHAPLPEDPQAPGADSADADGAGSTVHADRLVDRADGAAAAGTPLDAPTRLLLADLRRRLGPACRHWSPDAFESLVREIAHRKVRWGDAARRH